MSQQHGEIRNVHDGAFIFRPASSEDAGAVAVLTAQAIAARQGEAAAGAVIEDESVARTYQLLGQRATWSQIVVSDKGELVGCAFGYPQTDPESRLTIVGKEHLDTLMVAPGYWGKNIGSALLGWVARSLRDRSAIQVDLWTESTNSRARRLYERNGYLATGMERIHPRSGEQQTHYVLSLIPNPVEG